MDAYLNPNLSPAERAGDLLARMGVGEKMAQLCCVFPNPFDNTANLEAENPHGIGQVSCLEMRAVDSLARCAELQRDLQRRIMARSEHHIPAIFHMEGLCGAFLQGATSFPSGIGRASSWNPALERQVGRVVGRQERAVGVSHTFAPVLDISRDARMGRQGETYGEDPALAAAMGAAYTRGLQEERTGALGTEAVAKHFLGFHASEGGIHGAGCDVSERQLREVYAKPFQAAITESGLRGVMPCYNSINGMPVSGNAAILTGLLREEMGFDGLAVADYCAVLNIHNVQKVSESETGAGLLAMGAGMDQELHFRRCFNEELAGWFQSGRADMAVLDRAVRRVLEAKFRMGLFEQPFATEEGFARAGDAEVSLRAARESLVLLKNDGALPLSKSIKTLAVIGCHAGTARFQFGGYTHFSMTEGLLAAVSTMAGLQTGKDGGAIEIETLPGTCVQADDPAFEALLKKQKPDARSLLECLRARLPEAQVRYAYGYPFAGNDLRGHDEALSIARDADAVLLTLGGKHGTGSIASMGEGNDAADIGLPACQERLMEKLAEAGIPFVCVHMNGRPISSDVADAHASAILEAWNPAEFGAEAITAALLGDVNPGGKLPVSVARAAGQIPVYYNHPNGSSYHQGESIAFADYMDMPHAPRYFFGHGLSYTRFEYAGLTLDRAALSPDASITAAVTVRNAGDVPGDEVVQLYVRDLYASVTRPVMELAGFRRVTLQPGEERDIRFTMQASQFAFLDREMRWKVEAGEMELLVGGGSNDIRAASRFTITKDLWMDGRTRGFYAE